MAVSVTRTAPLSAPANPTASTGTASGDLTSGKTYYYRIKATPSASGNIGGEPTVEISATADANGSIDLSWDAVAGAYGYMIFRTHTSGDYSFSYNGGSNLDRDSHCLFLRNRNDWFRDTWTVEDPTTSLTDVGSETELPSGLASYTPGDNFKFRDWGQGSLDVSGGTDATPATFEDVYNADQSNGWNTFIKHVGGSKGYRTFECRDELLIDDYFRDDSAVVYYYYRINSAYATDCRFGFDSSRAQRTRRGVHFIYRAPHGRQGDGSLRFQNTQLYGCMASRDWEESVEKADFASIPSHYAPSGSIIFYDYCVVRNWRCSEIGFQNLNLIGDVGCEYYNCDFFDNMRGFNISNDQSANTFDYVRLGNNTFAFAYGSGTVRNVTVLTITDSLVRWYGQTDETLNLVNVTAPYHNLDSGNVDPYNATNCVVNFQWTFDLKVLSPDGNAIENASVELKDSQGNVTSLSTDANGETTQQDLTEKNIVSNGSSNAVTDYNSFTLTIKKSGFKTYKSAFNLNEETKFKIRLEKFRFRDVRNR